MYAWLYLESNVRKSSLKQKVFYDRRGIDSLVDYVLRRSNDTMMKVDGMIILQTRLSIMLLLSNGFKKN